jgi:hypothetical protein
MNNSDFFNPKLNTAYNIIPIGNPHKFIQHYYGSDSNKVHAAPCFEDEFKKTCLFCDIGMKKYYRYVIRILIKGERKPYSKSKIKLFEAGPSFYSKMLPTMAMAHALERKEFILEKLQTFNFQTFNFQTFNYGYKLLRSRKPHKSC